MSKGTLKVVKGDVTCPQASDNERVMIPHIVNTIRVMGAGVALALRKKWDNVYDEYLTQELLLGGNAYIEVEPSIVVVNMVAQLGIVNKDNSKPIKYAALIRCMEGIREYIDCAHENNCSNFDKTVIHAPQFGSDLAGGNWNFILELIHEIWLEAGIDVVIYKFEPDKTKWGEIKENG